MIQETKREKGNQNRVRLKGLSYLLFYQLRNLLGTGRKDIIMKFMNYNKILNLIK